MFTPPGVVFELGKGEKQSIELQSPPLFKEHSRKKAWSEASDDRDHINELPINGPLAEFWRWNISAITVVHKKSREHGMAVYDRCSINGDRDWLEVKIPLATLKTTHGCV